jgi:hypothetical protein
VDKKLIGCDHRLGPGAVYTFVAELIKSNNLLMQQWRGVPDEA